MENPTPGFFKLNFDGASKGNPGKVGYAGVFRYTTGQILQFFYGRLGTESNNAAELTGLLQGIRIAFNQVHFPLIVEEDSKLIMNMAIKLQNGYSCTKVLLARDWIMIYNN